jgi:hypothetical protein
LQVLGRHLQNGKPMNLDAGTYNGVRRFLKEENYADYAFI